VTRRSVSLPYLVPGTQFHLPIEHRNRSGWNRHLTTESCERRSFLGVREPLPRNPVAPTHPCVQMANLLSGIAYFWSPTCNYKKAHNSGSLRHCLRNSPDLYPNSTSPNDVNGESRFAISSLQRCREGHLGFASCSTGLPQR
jgi:hypothetical protein